MRKSTAIETFSQDSYVTSDHTKRYPGDRLFLSSRWWFYFRFAGVVVKASHLARKGVYPDQKWMDSSFDIFKHIEGCGGRFQMEGLDNIRKVDGPVVVVSNHMSTLETMVLPCVISPYRPLTFVVKDTLVKGKIFGPVMRSRNPIVVGRTNPREDFRVVMDQGKEILGSGKSLVIFPQSTRTLSFIPSKFNSLGVKLAKKSGAWVLPLAIKTDFWGDSKILKGFGALNRKKTIYMTFGEPIKVETSGKKEHTQVVEFLRTHLESWGGTVEE